MEKYATLLSLIIGVITTSNAQTNNENNDKLKTTIMNFENVKTDSINVEGTEFYYRKLGENNSGVPIIFLNHLSATMDECDPRIMDGLTSSHQIICFDNRGVGATKGTNGFRND